MEKIRVIFCAEIVHILSSDDEEDKTVTAVVTSATQNTSAASTVASMLTYRVCDRCCYPLY